MSIRIWGNSYNNSPTICASNILRFGKNSHNVVRFTHVANKLSGQNSYSTDIKMRDMRVIR